MRVSGWVELMSVGLVSQPKALDFTPPPNHPVMSSPAMDEDAVMHDPNAAELPAAADDPMDGAEDDDEGEGDELQPTGDMSEDSSQEEDEDEDALQKIRDGFIVDEDEEDEEEDDEEQRRRKRRKRRHRRALHLLLQLLPLNKHFLNTQAEEKQRI